MSPSLSRMNLYFLARAYSIANLHRKVIPPMADVHFESSLQYGTIDVTDW